MVYSFHRSFGLLKEKQNNTLPDHLKWVTEHKKQMVLLFMVSVPLIVFCSFKLTLVHIIALIPIGLTSMGYTIPVIPGSGKNIGLREIPGLKIFIISFIVCCVTVFLPVISAWDNMNISDSEILFLFSERFLFVFAITVPFDIRDMAFDKAKLTKTIPVMFGEKKAKLAAFFSLAVCAGISLLHLYSGEMKLPSMLAMLISLVISAVFIYKTTQTRSGYFFSFWMESMMVVQTALVGLTLLNEN